MSQIKKVKEALQFIQAKTHVTPKIAIVLGSGMGKLANLVEDAIIIKYEDIPHWPQSTAPGHAGRLVLGKIKGTEVLVMQGRVHYYEGYTMEEVTFPTRVIGTWKIPTLILTNASGGINWDYAPGDIMMIQDHINYTGTNPLIGKNTQEWGDRFPDMSEIYAKEYIQIASEEAQKLNIPLHKGVYIAFSGPSYETPAEIRMSRTMGADAVGMSTVAEAIVANHMGLKICGISCVANKAAGMAEQKLSGEEVLEAVNAAADKIKDLILAIIPRMV